MSVINNGSEDEEHIQYEEIVKNEERRIFCMLRIYMIQVTRAQNEAPNKLTNLVLYL